MKCVLLPKGPNGKDSELFKHFRTKYDRDTAILVYGIVREDTFKDFMGDWESNPDEYSGKLNASGEPVVSDIELYMDKHNMFAPSSSTSSHAARPKFQKLIDAKSEELRDISGKMSKAAKDKRDAATPQEKVIKTKVLHSLRAKQDLVEDDIYRLSRSSALEDIEEYAHRDMQELEEIFSAEDVSYAELQRALRISELWVAAGDFSGKEHLFFDELEMDAVLNGELPEMSDKFTDWARIAMQYKSKYITPLTEKAIQADLESTFGEDVEFDPNEVIKDKDFLTTHFLDISETDSPLLQGIAHWVKRANFEAHKEASDIFKKIEELSDNLTTEEMELLHQTVSNTDDRLTGNITHRYSQAYFDKMKALSYGFGDRVNAIPTKNRKEFYRRLYEEYKQLYAQKSATQVVFDPRILFDGSEDYTGKASTDEQKAKHTAHLKKHVGEKGYQRMYDKAEEKVEAYTFDKEAKDLELQDRYSDELADGDKTGYELDLKRWKYNNSPFLAAQFRTEGYKPAKEYGIVIRPENEIYLIVAPRRFDYKGKDTGLYDDKFERIEENEQLLEFYNYTLNTLNTIKKYLPKVQTGHMQLNMLPTIKKTVMEEYQRDGMGAGLNPLMAALNAATRTDDLATEGRELNPITGEPRKELQTQYLQDPSKEIKEYVERMSIQYKQDTGKSPDSATTQEWKRERGHALASQKSYDFVKIVKAFSMMGLTYKHKSELTDRMRSAQLIVDNQYEAVTNAAGDPMTTHYGTALKKMKSLKNTKAMLDYYMNSAFWGYAKHKPEGQTKAGGKSYNKGEKQVKAELEAMLVKNQEQLDNKEIEAGEFATRKDVIENQLEVLGGIRTASKYGDLALQYVGLKGLGWNAVAALGNLGFGFISNIIQAAGGQQYTVSEYRKAMFLLRHSVVKNFTFNTVENAQAKKVRSLMDRLDVLKELRNELYESSDNSTSGVRKITKKAKWMDPYAPQARSEYINQAAIMVAMMMHKKVTLNGEETSLWDAYDTDGKIMEGTDFDDEAEFKIKVKIDKMIKGEHGNYDTLDAPIKLKEQFLGRAFSQFRTWAFMGFANRFQSEFYDYQLEMARKGRYRSLFPAIKEAAKMMKEDGGITGTVFILKQLLKKASFGYYNADFNRMEGLSEVDRVNMRKNLMELVVYLSMASVGLMLKGLAKGMDDDDKLRGPIYFSLNLLSRMQTDILFYTNPVEFEKLQRNVLPIFSLVTDSHKAYTHASNLVMGYEDDLASGPNKGESKTKRAVAKLIPGPIQYYKIKSAMAMLYNKDTPGKKAKSPWYENFWSDYSASPQGFRLGD